MSAGAAVACIVVLVAGIPATHTEIVDDGAPGLLVLETAPAPFEAEFEPGDRGSLTVSASLDAPGPASLTVAVSGSGPLAEHPEGLRLELRECTDPWTMPGAGDAVCPGTESVVVPEAALGLLPGDTRDLGTLRPGTPRHLLATVSLPDSVPGSLMGERGEFVLRFEAAGDVEVSGSTPPGAHPITGVAVAVPLGVAVALGVVGAGLARRGSRARRPARVP